jgi:hypothetical protein
LDFDRATFSSRLPLLSVLTCSFLLSLYIFKCAIDHAQTLENMPLPRDHPNDHPNDQPKSYAQVIRSLQRGQRAQTFDPGTRTKTTTEGNAVRARFQGIVKSVTVEKKNTYRHEPIDYDNEIRILKILHGEGNDKLECMLFPSKLRKDKDRNGDGNGKGAERTDRYWALSYSWGDMNEVASNKITIYHE